MAKTTAAADVLVTQRYLLARHVPSVVPRAPAHLDWATGNDGRMT